MSPGGQTILNRHAEILSDGSMLIKPQNIWPLEKCQHGPRAVSFTLLTP